MLKFRMLLLISISFISFVSVGQDKVGDSLKKVIEVSKEDTNKVNTLIELSKLYVGSQPEVSLLYGTQAKDLADKLKYVRGEGYAYKWIGMYYFYIPGKNIEALDNWLQSLNLFKSINDKLGISNMLSNIGTLYQREADDAKSLEYTLQALALGEELGHKLRIATAAQNIGNIYLLKKATWPKAVQYLLRALPLSIELNNNSATVTIYTNLGDAYLKLGKIDSSLFYLKKGLAVSKNTEVIETAYILNNLGKTYLQRGDYDQSISYHTQSMILAKKLKSNIDVGKSLLGLGDTYFKMGDFSSSQNSYLQAAALLKEAKSNEELKDAYNGLTNTYAKQGDYVKAYSYQSLFTSLKDTIYNAEADKKMNNLQFEFNINKKQNEINLLTKEDALKELNLQKQRTYKVVLAIGLFLVLMVAVLIFRSYRQKHKANTILEKTLTDLKSTQAQLIQSEKMASLGELTAGIAHEIQNPLNFVNNFSELNTELIVEMKAEIEKGNLEDAVAIANDIEVNSQKINHHGKRADGIVKGMLQHSQTSNGAKEITDINVLAEEYMRLAYHGQKAKDEYFNVTISSDFDSSLTPMSIIPQGIGKVLLNLINNAFYAVGEKKVLLKESYHGLVTIGTKRVEDANGKKIRIFVRDNANGIPQKIADKIFQPFFTTKPTGQGTGLGLSLSYDIIKSHGGTLQLETTEGKGSTFVIELPG